MTRQQTSQLAKSIQLLAQLPDGEALVQILGQGTETSNEEALENWVGKQGDLLTIEEADFRLQQLMHRLRNTLDGFSLICGD